MYKGKRIHDTLYIERHDIKHGSVGTSEIFEMFDPDGEKIRPPRGVRLEPRQSEPYNHYLSCLDVKFDPTA